MVGGIGKMKMKDKLISANKLRKDFLDLPNCYNGFSDTYDKALIIDVIDEQPTVDAIPIEWLENFTNNYCDIAAAIDTQFFINKFILKRWRVESEGKGWTPVKNNAEITYQYLKKLLREGKTLEAAKFVEEEENGV